MNNVCIRSLFLAFAILVVIVFHPLSKLNAQQLDNSIDSLKRTLSHSVDDTEKVNLLIAISKAIGNSDTVAAIEYANDALRLSEKINWEKGMLNSNFELGLIYSNSHNSQFSALKYYLIAAKMAEQLGDKTSQSSIYNSIASDYYNFANFSNAIEYYRKVLTLHSNSEEEITALSNMGVIYKNIGDYPASLACYDSSLEELERSMRISNRSDVNDSIQLAALYFTIGDIYLEMYQYKKALAKYDDALKLGEQTSAKFIVIIALTGIAKTYKYEDDYAKAIEYYGRALVVCGKARDKRSEADIQDQLATVYLDTGDMPRALEYAKRSLQLAQSNNYDYLVARGHITLGRIYNALKEYPKAIGYLTKAIVLCRESGTLANQKDALEQLSIAYEKTNQSALALNTFKEFITIRDSLYNIDKANEITRIDLQSGYDRKALADSLVQAKKDVATGQRLQQQRITIYAGFAGLALVLLLSFFIYRNYSHQKKANVIIQREKDNAEQQRQRAEQSEQFKQQFLANMSHEIRTPMNAVMGMTNLVLDTPLQDNQKFYLDGIKKSADNLLHIINDILDLSKIEAGKMELEQIDFAISGTVEQVKQTLAHRAEEKGLQLLADIGTDVADVVIGDPGRLNQVLINLTGNAIKFTEKGSVTIEVRKTDGGTRFSIIDTGIGIPKDKLQTVFENFSQANASDTRKYGGTGLGLSISRQLVELMGGDIGIESEEGSGTTFSFTVNFEAGSEERLQQRLAAEEEVDGSILNGLAVLIVDDNEYNRIVARDTLEAKATLKVVTAAGGGEAIELLQQQHFDVVLMDVQMPVMNGFEATRYIRSLIAAPVSSIPIIALTASVLRTDLDKCRQAGMDSYIPKPFKASQLIAGIAQVLNIPLRTAKKKEYKAVAPVQQQRGVTDIAYLTEFCEGDMERLKKYVEIYLRAVSGFEEKATEALKAGNMTKIAALVHTFKPKWLMMGMNESSELGNKVEAMCHEGSEQEKIGEFLEVLFGHNRQSVTELEGMG